MRTSSSSSGVPPVRQVGHLPMPTVRPRHQITETPEVARAIGVAAQRWPGEPRSRLLLRLIEAGRAALEVGADAQAREWATGD